LTHGKEHCEHCLQQKKHKFWHINYPWHTAEGDWSQTNKKVQTFTGKCKTPFEYFPDPDDPWSKVLIFKSNSDWEKVRGLQVESRSNILAFGVSTMSMSL